MGGGGLRRTGAGHGRHSPAAFADDTASVALMLLLLERLSALPRLVDKHKALQKAPKRIRPHKINALAYKAYNMRHRKRINDSGGSICAVMVASSCNFVRTGFQVVLLHLPN